MAVSHRGAISFGMVHIPVGLYTATQDNDIHFNQLCKADGSRVKYKKVCAGCGKEIGSGDIVKGFEYEKGKYVTLTDDDFEKAKSEKDRTIHILHFTALQNIRPIYYDKTYHAVPEQGGDKAFELLRRAMKDENKVAVAKTVMGTKEKLLALIPTDDGILIETLFYWTYYTKPRRDFFVNHPLLKGFVDRTFGHPFEAVFEPIHMAHVQAAKILSKKSTDADLLNIYKIWAEKM